MKKIITKILKSNFSWLSLNEIVTFTINYILIIVQAKLLSPEKFGVVVLLNLMVNFFSIIANLGFEKIIISRQIKNNVTLNGILSGLFIYNILIFIVSLIFLPFFLKFYFDSFNKYFFLGFLTLTSIILSTFFTFFRTLLIRDRLFVLVSKIMIFSNLVVFFLTIILSYRYPTIEMIVIKQLLFFIIPTLALVYFVDYKFQIIFSKKIIFRVFEYSKFITLNGIFNFLTRNIDYIIIGRFFDTNIVGQYSIAYKILVTPVKMLTKQIDTISFPNYSILKNDIIGFKKYYLNNLTLISQTLFPIIIPIILFSNVIVELFFDQRYDKLAFMITVLSIGAIFQSLTATVGNIYIIFDNTKKMFYISIFLSIILSIALFIGAKTYNINYFTIIYTSTYVITNFPISNYFALKPLNISIYDFFKVSFKPLIISLLVFGIYYQFSTFFKFNNLCKFIGILILIVLVYVFIHERIKKVIFK